MTAAATMDAHEVEELVDLLASADAAERESARVRLPFCSERPLTPAAAAALVRGAAREFHDPTDDPASWLLYAASRHADEVDPSVGISGPFSRSTNPTLRDRGLTGTCFESESSKPLDELVAAIVGGAG
jgi:hypothetical protein